jgi:tRNA A-37 threonylcarbamoyl transferase component Bud32
MLAAGPPDMPGSAPLAVTCPTCTADTGTSAQFCPACGTILPRVTGNGDPLVGKVVARKYSVEQCIGEGGMGKVYRARQLVLDKPVVLKVLHQELLSDARTVARFQREARAASRLNHPNSINILDFGVAEDGELFIAMEYVDGHDLHHLLTNEWPLPEPRIIRIVSQVLSALADAHSVGVIHRDLKPENVMVEPRRGGESDVVKVLDFGIAKIVDTAEAGPALTRAGFVCGTPEYMSPEQAKGAPLDARSDLYSVGVLLFQLVTRRLPFDADTAVGFATKHLTEPPPPPSRFRPGGCSPEMEQLILRALSKDPADRPQTAEDFLESLNALPAGESSHSARTARVVMPLGATAERARKVDIGTARTLVTVRPPPPRRLGVLGAAGIGMGIAALVGIVAIFALRPQPSARPVSAPQAPAWQLEVPAERRDAKRSAELAKDGDNLYEAGDLALARAKYLEAFEADPTPELALKLGVLARLRGQPGADEAQGFLARHLSDAPDSRARSQILRVSPDFGGSR